MVSKKPYYKTKTFKVIVQLSMTAVICIAEALTGYISNCMALMSDSFHTLSDCISLSVGLIAIRVRNHKIEDNSLKTFGYQRAEVLGGIIQAVFLYGLCFNIYITAIQRFLNPEPLTHLPWILSVGGLGLFINVVGLFLFMETGDDGHGHSHNFGKSDASEELMEVRTKMIDEGPEVSRFSLVENGQVVPQEKAFEESSSQNLNTRGIFLHLLGDTLGSVAVMISAGLLWYFDAENQITAAQSYAPDANGTCTGDQKLNYASCDMCWLLYVDPFLTFLIATIICTTTWPLFKQSVNILMEICPEDVNLEDFRQKLENEVRKIGLNCNVNLTTENNNNAIKVDSEIDRMLIHDLHIWQLDSKTRAGTVHILIYRCGSLDDAVSRYIRLVKVLKREFKKINVKTLTIQPEFINPKTSDCDKRDCGNDCGGANDIEDLGKSTIKDFP